MIKDNILKIRERIALACAKAGCQSHSVNIVAVSKGRPAEEIKEVIAAGIVDIGENRVQEALGKFYQLRATGYRVRTHLVGHLQTNKVKEAVKIFDLIQSVDSLRLAQEIDKQAARMNKLQDILLEIKTSPEESKFGIKPDAVIEVSAEMAGLKNVRVRGLMTIAPLADDPQKARPYFRMLRELQNELNDRRGSHDELNILSMGMTDDFEVAIEEGSNMLRLGRAIFEG